MMMTTTYIRQKSIAPPILFLNVKINTFSKKMVYSIYFIKILNYNLYREKKNLQIKYIPET